MFESFTLVSVWWNGADVGEVGVRQPTRKSVDLFSAVYCASLFAGDIPGAPDTLKPAEDRT